MIIILEKDAFTPLEEALQEAKQRAVRATTATVVVDDPIIMHSD